MFCLTLNVLLRRYEFTLRERWLLTVCYLSIPLLLCVIVVSATDLAGWKRYNVHVEDHDERSILQAVRFPEGYRNRFPNNGSRDLEEYDWTEAGFKREARSLSFADADLVEDDSNSTANVTRSVRIIVCPDGTKERALMDTLEIVWRQSDVAVVLDIRYVHTPDELGQLLASLHSNQTNTSEPGYQRESTPKGLHFLEISTKNLTYEIRPPVRYGLGGTYDWWDFAPTELFPTPMLRGPRKTDPYFNTITYDGAIDGFLPLQVAVDKAYIKMYFSNDTDPWVLSSLPHPPFTELPPNLSAPPNVLSHRDHLIFITYILIAGNFLMIAVFISNITNDKVGGIRELLCLNGAVHWLVNLSWLISFCVEVALLVNVQVGLLRIPTQYGPTVGMKGPVLMLVLLAHNWLTLCWVQFVSSIIKEEKLCVLIVLAYCMFSPAFNWIPPDRFSLQGGLAALPNAGLVLIFMSFQEFDGAETELGFGRLSTNSIHYLPVGTLLQIMFATMLVLILLVIYVDLIMPGPYGRAKPWYLLETEVKVREQPSKEYFPDIKYIEPIGNQDPIGLECVGISLVRSHQKAVSSVNMKIPKNKITVLLGPNGSGKTSLFSILCGVHSPTSGTCYTEDYEVLHGGNMNKFRKVLGYCPQSNLLMKELTVKQHLIIFGLLKGLSRFEAGQRSDTWCEDLKKFENIRVKHLSMGTKRQLCLAIAMTGDPQYLILDEPSSGLDIKSRRIFWNVLLRVKNNCTVIMSTHDMDEADVLADRVAFMVLGQLVGYGSSSFLKKKLDTGYKLNCTINQKDQMRFFAFTEKFDRSIVVLSMTRNTVTLGFPQNNPKMVQSFVKGLESEFRNDVATSLSPVTLDDVFVKFQSPSKIDNSPNSAELLEIENNIDRSCNCDKFCGLFRKKIELVFDQSFITSVLVLLIIPIIGVILALHFMNIYGPKNYKPADLTLTMGVYKGKTAFINGKDTGSLNEALLLNIKGAGLTVKVADGDVLDTLRETAKKNLLEYRSDVVFAFDSANEPFGIPIAYYSRNAFHSAPIAYSTLINALLMSVNASDVPSITTHNVPYSPGRNVTICSQSGSDPGPGKLNIVFLVFLGPAFLVVAAYFIIFPHTERRLLFKHLQLTTGLLPWVYWVSHLMFDLVLFSMSALFVIIFLATDPSHQFSSSEVVTALSLVFLLYGISAITLAYVFSFFKCATSITMAWFVCIPTLTALICALTLRSLFYIRYMIFMPWLLLLKSLMTILEASKKAKSCYDCKGVNCDLVLKSLISSLAFDFVCLLFHTLVNITFIIAMDHGFGRRLKPMFVRLRPSDMEPTKDISADVVKEKERVRYLVEKGEEPELVCEGLWKKYSSGRIAVRDLTFAVDRGKLFCILGGNGSGKSSAMFMLAGVMGPTEGSAVVRGRWDLTDCEHKYIKNVGYCPRYRGLLPGLTSRSTLRFFARLRGLKPSIRNSHVDRWIQALDMVSIADKQCQLYSAGNQRKLSFAAAMIGRPSVVLLDAPTARIDPFVRRRIWAMFGLDNAGQTVILTSHTMSEVEAVSDRVTFLTNGEMNCLGSVPELKNKFGKSCTLQVKLRDDVTPKQSEATMKKILEQSQFSRYAELKSEQANSLTIVVKLDEIKVQDVLTEITSIRDSNSSIDDIILTETSLEGVFTKLMSIPKSSKS